MPLPLQGLKSFLGILMPLCRRFAIPFHSLIDVFGHAITVLIAESEIELSFGIPLLCCLSIPFYSLLIILLYTIAM